MFLFDLVNNKKNKKIKKEEIKKQYQQYPSLSNKLPWLEWSDKHNVVLLEDGRSIGALLEIRDIATEAKPQEFTQKMHESIAKMFSNVVPQEDENPWVLQFFVEDDLTLESLYRKLQKYTKDQNDTFTLKYLEIMRHHFKLMSQENGLFIDPMSNLPFRGKTRRIRVAVYRRYADINKSKNNESVLEELNATVSKLISQLQQIGLKVRRMRGEHFYDWLVRWFNPKPKKTKGNVDQLLKLFPYSQKKEKEKKPFGWSFCQNVFFGNVESYDNGWIFDDIKHKVLVFKDLQEEIDIGVISRERNFGENNKYSLLDKFPPGTIYTIQIVFESKNKIKRHLLELEKAAVGKSLVIKEILENIERAYKEIESGNMLFRCVEAIYFRGESVQDLKDHELTITSLLNNSGLDVIETSQELYPQDTYLRFLPFNFNYHFDKKNTYRSTYKYADDVVRLLPIYGRSRGDGLHPLHIYFNRGGEGFIFDHLHPEFKRSNSHMAIIGSTGAGKSVLLNYFCMSAMAVRNPRIILIEAGGSFDILTRFFAEYGKKVRSIKFQRISPIAINPYAESEKALQAVEHEERLLKENALEKILEKEIEKQTKEIQSQKNQATEQELSCEEDRDILSEMALATRTMITGGDNKEEEKITRADMMLINRVLIYSMKKCKNKKNKKNKKTKQMLVQHVIAGFQEMAAQEQLQEISSRLKRFALSMEEYQTGLKAKFINRESEPLGDYDFLQIELGFLQEKKYQDFLNIVCISLLAKVLALAESAKETGRPTILIMDEAHILFKSEMVAAFVTLMAKVARKIGLWLIPCTQNLNDFCGIESKKVLSMMETWLCLAIEKDEVDLINKFKPLTEEAKSLILDIRKYPKIYSEGVLLAKNYQGLFRNIPPRIALSLAMTEQDERSERKKLQTQKGLTEMQAVEHIAKKLESYRLKTSEDKDFDD